MATERAKIISKDVRENEFVGQIGKHEFVLERIIDHAHTSGKLLV